MPREGYEVITITKEAREALNELKIKMNAKSVSEVIIKLNKLVDTFFTILVPEYSERTRYTSPRSEEDHYTPIRIQIPAKRNLKQDLDDTP